MILMKSNVSEAANETYSHYTNTFWKNNQNQTSLAQRRKHASILHS